MDEELHAYGTHSIIFRKDLMEQSQAAYAQGIAGNSFKVVSKATQWSNLPLGGLQLEVTLYYANQVSSMVTGAGIEPAPKRMIPFHHPVM